MPGRRHVLPLIASAGLLLLAPPRARAEPPDPIRAAAFIKQAGNELTTVVGDATTPDEKRRRLQPFIDRVVNVESVARFCLGRFWRQATPEEQRDYTAVFHRVLMNSIIAHMGDYRQTRVNVVIGRPELREGEAYVPTTIEREGNPPANVTWVVQSDAGGLRIVDVIAEGTSLRLTTRSDYNAFLTRHNNSVTALIEALRQQAAG